MRLLNLTFVLIDRLFNWTKLLNLTSFPIDSFCHLVIFALLQKNFRARPTLTVQNNMILDEGSLIIVYSSSEIPAQSWCSHLKQHSYSIPHTLTCLLHVMRNSFSPLALSFDFLLGGDYRSVCHALTHL